MHTPADTERRTGTQSIARAAQVLRVLSERDRFGWGLLDLAARCDLSRGTAHRILQGLVREGLVEQRAADRRYVLGPLVFEMGLAMSSHAAFQSAVRAPITRLAREVGMLAILYLRSGSDYVCAARAGPSPYSMAFEVGTRAPLVSSAGGIAILIALPEAASRRAEAEGLRQMQHLGPALPPRLQRVIERSRALGYAFNEGEVTRGVNSLGLPVRDAQDQVVAAVTVSGRAEMLPRSRVPEVLEHMREAVAGVQAEAHHLRRGAPAPD